MELEISSMNHKFKSFKFKEICDN